MADQQVVASRAGVCTGDGPCVHTPLGEGKNWVTHTEPVDGLGPYVRAIAHALEGRGMSESQSIATAIATVKHWAAGGGKVTADTRARAAAAVAHWEAMKAKSHTGARAVDADQESEAYRQGMTDRLNGKGFKTAAIFNGATPGAVAGDYAQYKAGYAMQRDPDDLDERFDITPDPGVTGDAQVEGHRSVSQDNAAYQEGVSDKKAGKGKLSAGAFKETHADADADDYPLYVAGWNADRTDLHLELAAAARSELLGDCGCDDDPCSCEIGENEHEGRHLKLRNVRESLEAVVATHGQRDWRAWDEAHQGALGALRRARDLVEKHPDRAADAFRRAAHLHRLASRFAHHHAVRTASGHAATAAMAAAMHPDPLSATEAMRAAEAATAAGHSLAGARNWAEWDAEHAAMNDHELARHLVHDHGLTDRHIGVLSHTGMVNRHRSNHRLEDGQAEDGHTHAWMMPEVSGSRTEVSVSRTLSDIPDTGVSGSRSSGEWHNSDGASPDATSEDLLGHLATDHHMTTLPRLVDRLAQGFGNVKSPRVLDKLHMKDHNEHGECGAHETGERSIGASTLTSYALTSGNPAISGRESRGNRGPSGRIDPGEDKISGSRDGGMGGVSEWGAGGPPNLDASGSGNLLPVGPSKKQAKAIETAVAHRFKGKDLQHCSADGCGQPILAPVHQVGVIGPKTRSAELRGETAETAEPRDDISPAPTTHIEDGLTERLQRVFAEQRKATISRLTGKRGKQMLKAAGYRAPNLGPGGSTTPGTPPSVSNGGKLNPAPAFGAATSAALAAGTVTAATLAGTLGVTTAALAVALGYVTAEALTAALAAGAVTLAAVIAAYPEKGPGTAETETGDAPAVEPTHIFEKDMWDDKLGDEMKPYYAMAAQQGAENVRRQVELPVATDDSRALTDAQQAVADRGNMTSPRINDTTYRAIVDQLQQAIGAGEGIEQMATRVNGVFDEADRVRARRIAQTETISALNSAAHAYAQALPEGSVGSKRWLAHHDERTRLHHRDADGQTVPVATPFYVGGYPLQFPGDPTAPPDEIINCRCVAAFLPPRTAPTAAASVAKAVHAQTAQDLGISLSPAAADYVGAGT